MSLLRLILLGKAGTGKDTVAAYLAGRCGFRCYAFADKIREIGRDLFPEHFQDGAKPRRLLQDLGIKMRELGPDCWTNYVLRRIATDDPLHAVITDCRYLREIALAGQAGFLPVLVDCPTEIRLARLAARDGGSFRPEDLQHVSEQETESAAVAGTVLNTGTLADLEVAVDRLLYNLYPGQLT